MDIAAIGSLVPLKNINGVNTKSSEAGIVQGSTEGFESIFKSALDMVKGRNEICTRQFRQHSGPYGCTEKS